MSLRIRDDRGTAAVLIAAGMVLFLGITALAIDIGFGFNERRQDQTAADTGVMGGAVDALNGGTGVRDQALDYIRKNLDTTYSNAQWQALWEGCVDPAAERNQGGAYNFVALTPPAGWTVADPANWCLSFESARGLLRARVPDQFLDTTFGQVLGVDQLRTHATAVSRLQPRGSGGILPFGLPLGSGDAGLLCLSSGPTGLATDPCNGPASGNFGTLKGRLFGNPDIPTPVNCNSSPLGQVLAMNIAAGYDHVVVPDKDGAVANEVRDNCFNPFVDTLNTDTGFPGSGAEAGLIGPMPAPFTPRLAQNGPTVNVFGRPANHVPLWNYLNPLLDYTGATATPADDAPANCRPQSFNNATNPLFDWDGNGIDDLPGSWQHMDVCMDDYNGGGYTTQLFTSAIGNNGARFGYVPEFWETSLGSGNSWLHIHRFRAIYIQTTTWKQGTSYVHYSPGEPCDDGSGTPVPCTGSHSMVQLTAFVIPDTALPADLRGSPPPGGTGVNIFEVELYD